LSFIPIPVSPGWRKRSGSLPRRRIGSTISSSNIETRKVAAPLAPRREETLIRALARKQEEGVEVDVVEAEEAEVEEAEADRPSPAPRAIIYAKS
jgi:hypothetical protein